jgi:hypothetical protein
LQPLSQLTAARQPPPDPWHKLKQDFNAVLGLATSDGLALAAERLAP